jgi:putative redox protein
MSQTMETGCACTLVNLENYDGFVQQVQADPSQGFFRFTAKTSWKGGAVTETTARGRSITADEPEGLGGTDSAADPVELLLAALTSCVSIGIATQAAKRGIHLEDFEIEVGGDLDLRGYFGLDSDIRPGYTGIQYTVKVKSDADRAVIEDILRTAERTSPMLDNIRNGVPVTTRLEMVA